MQQNKKFNKPFYNKTRDKYPFIKKKKYSYKNKNNIYYILGEKRPSKPLITSYLYRNKKKRIGIFFKTPTFKSILYPFHLNMKLINEYLKKK
jgi:hypothetical protein